MRTKVNKRPFGHGYPPESRDLALRGLYRLRTYGNECVKRSEPYRKGGLGRVYSGGDSSERTGRGECPSH